MWTNKLCVSAEVFPSSITAPAALEADGVWYQSVCAIVHNILLFFSVKIKAFTLVYTSAVDQGTILPAVFSLLHELVWRFYTVNNLAVFIARGIVISLL